jgi:hypothetical protein
MNAVLMHERGIQDRFRGGCVGCCATVLIAPSTDMPETVLREHHVASHSTVNNSPGNLVVVAMVSDAHAFRLSEGSEVSDHAHGHTSLVLRR